MRRLPVSCFLALAVVGCGTPRSLLRSPAPIKEPSDAKGLRYYLPRDVVTVDVVATFNTGKGFSPDVAAESLCKPGPNGMNLKQVDVTVNQSTIPDRRVAYNLTMDHSESAAQTFKLAVSNDGLLTSINYSSEDKRAEIAGNILKTVASVAGTVIGVDRVIPGGFKAAGQPTARDRGEKCALQSNHDAMAKLLLARDTLEAQHDSLLRLREAKLREAATAKKDADLKLIQSRDDVLGRLVTAVDSRLTTVTTAIAANVSKFKSDAGITGPDTVIRTSAIFDVASMPQDSKVVGALKSVKAAESALAGNEPALRLLDSTRVVVTMADDDASGALNPPVLNGTISSGDCTSEGAPDDCLHVFTRMPRPRIVRIYVPTGATADNAFALRETRLVSLVSSADLPIDVPVSTRSLGQETFTMTFARPGTLTGFEQTSSGGLAAATSSLATAVSGARQEFVNSLQSVQTGQASLDAIQAESRASRLKNLQDQKSIIDAQVALQGTAASKDLIAQKQQVDAEIALLTSQQALTTAQASAAVNGDVAAMRAQIQQLQAQIDLLKAQLDLAKAKKDSTP